MTGTAAGHGGGGVGGYWKPLGLFLLFKQVLCKDKKVQFYWRQRSEPMLAITWNHAAKPGLTMWYTSNARRDKTEHPWATFFITNTQILLCTGLFWKAFLKRGSDWTALICVRRLFHSTGATTVKAWPLFKHWLWHFKPLIFRSGGLGAKPWEDLLVVNGTLNWIVVNRLGVISERSLDRKLLHHSGRWKLNHQSQYRGKSKCGNYPVLSGS